MGTTKSGHSARSQARTRRPENDGRGLLLLSALGRALSHQIRTPLSVVSNELQYIKSTFPDSGCNRGLDRCREISDILSTLSVLNSHESGKIPVSIAKLIEELSHAHHIECKSEVLESTYNLICNCDQLVAVVSMLSTLLLDVGDQHAEQRNSGAHLSVEVADNRLLLHMKIPDYWNSRNLGSGLSITEIFSVRLGSDSLMPPLIDAVLWEHGAELTLETGESGWLAIYIPLSD